MWNSYYHLSPEGIDWSFGILFNLFHFSGWVIFFEEKLMKNYISEIKMFYFFYFLLLIYYYFFCQNVLKKHFVYLCSLSLTFLKKKNLLWISQVCLLPNSCNNSLNLLDGFLTTGKLDMLATILTTAQWGGQYNSGLTDGEMETQCYDETHPRAYRL